METQEGKAIAEVQSTMMEPDLTKKILQDITQERSFEGIAKQTLMEELENMPDSAKKDFVTDVLNSNGDLEKVLQKEILDFVPQVNPEYISDLMKNQNVKALIEDQFKTEMENSLTSFLNDECKRMDR
jgi:hypothetical protein